MGAVESRHSHTGSSEVTAQTKNQKHNDNDVISLNGIILGSPKTGKSSLLQRLSGEQELQRKTNYNFATIPWSRPPKKKRNKATINSDMNGYDVDTVKDINGDNNMNGDGDVDNYDETITLHITQEQEDEEQSNNTEIFINTVDFILVMIDPRNKSSIDYTERLLLDLSIKKNSPKPLSVCLLYNFRDVLPLTNATETVPSSSFSRLKNVTDIVVSSTTSLSTSSIECSMKNCYGLHLLYEFITIPYLMKRRYILDTKLKIIQKDIKSEQLFMDKYQMKHNYSSFLEKMPSLERKKKIIIGSGSYIRNPTHHVLSSSNEDSTSKQPIPLPETKVSPKEEESMNNDPLPKKEEKPHVTHQPSPSINQQQLQYEPKPISKKIETSVPEIKRQIMPSINNDPLKNKKKASKFQQSLDDFFSDEDDEDYNYSTTTTATTTRSSSNMNSQVYYDDDDDDDFYYDDDGTRHEHA